MAPTMQVACKAFIAPNPAARSPKERYTHVPRSLRRVRHARCFNGECPSEATDKIGMRHIYWSCCQNATSLSPISPLLLLWKRQRRGLAAPPPRISFTSFGVYAAGTFHAPHCQSQPGCLNGASAYCQHIVGASGVVHHSKIGRSCPLWVISRQSGLLG